MQGTNARHECRARMQGTDAGTNAGHECKARMQGTNAEHECKAKAGCPNWVPYFVVNFGWHTVLGGKINFSGLYFKENTKSQLSKSQISSFFKKALCSLILCIQQLSVSLKRVPHSLHVLCFYAFCNSPSVCTNSHIINSEK